MTRSGGPNEATTHVTVSSNAPGPRQSTASAASQPRPEDAATDREGKAKPTNSTPPAKGAQQHPAGPASAGPSGSGSPQSGAAQSGQSQSGQPNSGQAQPGLAQASGSAAGGGRTQPGRRGQQSASQSGPLRREESHRRTEQLALDGLRPDHTLGSPTVIGRTASRPTPPRPRPPADRSRVRRARLRAVRLDPWSVMKTAFLLSIAFAIVTMVSVTVVWQVLEAAGVYESINSTVRDVLGSAAETTFDLEQYIGLERVLGVTALICVVDVVLITAIATLGAFLYNLSASLLGGLEVTLAEEE